MAKQSLGYHQDYQVSRWAKYDSIGTEISDKSNVTDYDHAQNDRIGENNTAFNNVGYLGQFYTNNGELAKDMAGQVSTLTLTSGTYYLPDGYKGLGNIYQNNDNYRMKISALNGNNATISQNTEPYYYFKNNNNNSDVFDTQYTPASNNGLGNVGLGFINFQSQPLNATNLTLTGNVIADAIDSNSANGSHVPYSASLFAWGDTSDGNGEGIDRKQMASVGSFIGLVSAGRLTIDDISLNNVYVHGLKASGGLIGSCNRY